MRLLREDSGPSDLPTGYEPFESRTGYEPFEPTCWVQEGFRRGADPKDLNMAVLDIMLP